MDLGKSALMVWRETQRDGCRPGRLGFWVDTGSPLELYTDSEHLFSICQPEVLNVCQSASVTVTKDLGKITLQGRKVYWGSLFQTVVS